ncbi:hypothetical protein EDB80DRAFT_713948 [Ilyonectria destructans]|nr:hypothetical protein EDB80DRAFT_713948 [Ilyonectria destructans]
MTTLLCPSVAASCLDWVPQVVACPLPPLVKPQTLPDLDPIDIDPQGACCRSWASCWSRRNSKLARVGPSKGPRLTPSNARVGGSLNT